MAGITATRLVGWTLVAGVVGAVAVTFVQVYGDRQDRGKAQALLADASPYRDEVERALKARQPRPPATKKPRHARTISAGGDGAILIEVADDLSPGGRITLRPSTNARGDVMWTCHVQGIRLALVPAACRP